MSDQGTQGTQGTQTGSTSASSRASALFGPAAMEPNQMERMAILWLKIVAWVVLTGAILGACAMCAVGILSTNEIGIYGTSNMANLQRLSTILSSLGTLLTGVSAWAVFLVLASIADSLIMIRRNTAR